MFQVFRNAFNIPDLRKKILYTLMIIVVFRIGSSIPVPFLDPSTLTKLMAGSGGNFLGYLDALTGSSLSKATIFAMSITPYINASIIIQLLTVAIPALERMQKEGEDGRKKLNKITRYTTVGLGLLQATGFYFLLRSGKVNALKAELMTGIKGWFVAIVIIFAFTAGTALIMWLGERINEKGIGNGISILLFAGIISRAPAVLNTLWMYLSQSKYLIVISIVVAFILVVGFIVIMTNAERRIPVQYAKRVVGRKQYGGQSTHIPIKVSMSGVMPIIFASSIMSIPSMIATFAQPKVGTWWATVSSWFNQTGWIYAVLYFFLVIGFNFFYVKIQYNPIEISNNLRKNNGGIPGIRPGKPTSDFIDRILNKITFVGALFLALIAVLPIVISSFTKIQNLALGGTTVLIIVGVALETMRTLESQMMMRHHKGFLE